MNIVVTGGSGNVGRYVVRELLEHHEVTILDRRRPETQDVAFVQGDVLNVDDCRSALEGAEVVVHLAAIPHPMNDPGEVVMHVNVMGTYNVHQAASEVGVRRVVQASSDSSYGFVFRERDMLPAYLPLDEEHPQKPQDPYGLSKVIGEEIGRSFTRKCGLETVFMRICFVWFPQHAESYRALTEDPGQRKWMNGLWLYNDARDVARAFRLAVEAEGIESEAFLISAEDNGTTFETMELVRRYYPGDIALRKPIEGRQSLADWSKAKRMLGFESRYTWRDLLTDSDCRAQPKRA